MVNWVILLARVWGILLVVGGVALLVGGLRIAETVGAMRQNRDLVPLIMWPVLVLGAFNVSTVERWEPNIGGLVTLLGWCTLIKGAIGLIAPEALLGVASSVAHLTALRFLVVVVFLVAGAVLLWIGFVPA